MYNRSRRRVFWLVISSCQQYGLGGGGGGVHFISAILILYHTKFKLLPSYSLSILHTHEVTNLKAVNTTTNSTIITWDQPPHNYRVFLHGEATDDIPPSRVVQLVDVTGQTTHIVEVLNPFRNYSISVFLASDNGNGSNATVIVRTIGTGQRRVLIGVRMDG